MTVDMLGVRFSLLLTSVMDAWMMYIAPMAPVRKSRQCQCLSRRWKPVFPSQAIPTTGIVEHPFALFPHAVPVQGAADFRVCLQLCENVIKDERRVVAVLADGMLGNGMQLRGLKDEKAGLLCRGDRK